MNEDQPNPNPWLRSLMVWGGIFLALLLVVSMLNPREAASGIAIAYSDFRAKVAEGTVSEVQVSADKITGKYKNGDTFSTV
ncbi:MAG: ATP-dependent metallopeptidase FtsH/Yme1/Tma family protein, partial [Novosphingobium sp.]